MQALTTGREFRQAARQRELATNAFKSARRRGGSFIHEQFAHVSQSDHSIIYTSVSI
jgi:hypothetical protein